MENTGERYLPEFDGDWTLEHRHRYLLARELAAGKDVLDVACGEGYGSYLLAEAADTVAGVDISAETIARAKGKYRRPNLSFLQGSVLAIPLPDASMDLVVSFETLEHIAEHDMLLAEVRRVLRPGGVLCISTPDKRQYSDIPGRRNTFHVKELYRDEFAEMLRRRFRNTRMWGQRVVFGSVIGAEKDSQDSGDFLSWRKGEPDSRTVGLRDAMYLIVLASDGALPSLPSGLMDAPVEQSDYARALQGNLETAHAYISTLEMRISGFETQIDGLDARIKELEMRCAGQAAELCGLYASRSWRMTAPLRALANQFRHALRHGSE